MLQKVALTDISAWDVAAPLAVGGGLGVGARLLRHAFDLKTKRGLRAPKLPTSLESAQIEVPVDVSPEEAAELKAQGIKVGAALDRGPVAAPAIKVKAPVLPKAVPTNSTTMPGSTNVVMKTAVSGLAGNVMQGVLGAGAAAGGWALLDSHLDSERVAKAKASLMRSRERVKRLIAGEPDPSELGAAQALKTAEELFFKQAIDFTDVGASVVGGATDLMAPLGIPLGIGAALLGAKAYNETKASNKYRQRVKQITESLEGEEALPPVAVLHPRLRKQKASPAEAGVIHAEPALSPELDVKVAASDDDEEEGSSTKWIMLAVAGLAGAAGLMWVRAHPEDAKAMLPEWMHGGVDYVTQFGKPDPAVVAKVAPEAATGAPAAPAAPKATPATPTAPEAATAPKPTPAAPAAPTADPRAPSPAVAAHAGPAAVARGAQVRAAADAQAAQRNAAPKQPAVDSEPPAWHPGAPIPPLFPAASPGITATSPPMAPPTPKPVAPPKPVAA
jgi:hypothetical protein